MAREREREREREKVINTHTHASEKNKNFCVMTITFTWFFIWKFIYQMSMLFFLISHYDCKARKKLFLISFPKKKTRKTYTQQTNTIDFIIIC